MDGDVFRGFHNLKKVVLSSNQCIQENFETEAKIVKISKILSQKCDSCEKIADLTNCELRWELKDTEQSIMEKLKSEVESVRLEEKISACTTNLKANQELKTQVEGVRSANLKSHQELKSKMDENRSANLKTNQELKTQMEGVRSANLKSHQELKSKMDENRSANLKTNQELKTQMERIRSENLKANQELKTQVEEIRSANLNALLKLKTQMEETCAAKTKSLIQSLNEKFRSKLEALQSENNAKNAEINHLKLKLELFEEIPN
jgi:hypothetical protein